MSNITARTSRARRWAPVVGRWVAPIVDLRNVGKASRAYPSFLRSLRAYQCLDGAEHLDLGEMVPCLLDRTPTTPYDPHYFHQSVWAAERIVAARPQEHVDIGSETTYVGMLSVSVPVLSVDIRPLPVELQRLRSITGDLLALPLPDRSAASVSCLHVAEHVGLGRYGDRLAPDGTQRASAELARILAPQGNLYLSVPVGRPRVCFNAHRIHAPEQILAYFDELELVEFAVVDDAQRLVLNADLEAAATLSYGCGMFRFRRS